MAESYTNPHSLPVLGTADYVRSPSGDNLRKQLNALAAAANNAITAEGSRAEGAAKSYADTKDTDNRSAWSAADTSTLNSAKSYTDTKDTANRSAWAAADTTTLNSAKSYTDTKDSSNRTDWAAADTAKLSEAKAYAETMIGAKVISLDTDGVPYWNPSGGTMRLFTDVDGALYYADKPWPVVSADTDGRPAAAKPVGPFTFPPAAHTHDDRYYTEAEVDAKFTASESATGATTDVKITAASQEPKLADFITAVVNLAGMRTIPVMFLGDSFTANNQYPPAVMSRLQKRFPSGGAEKSMVLAASTAVAAPTGNGLAGYNVGIAGAGTHNYVSDQIVTNTQTVQPHILIHSIGCNNWAGNNDLPQRMLDYRAALDRLDAVLTVPHVHVLMHSNWRFDISVDSTARAYSWAQYGAEIKKIAAEDPARRVFVDNSNAFRVMDVGGADYFAFRHTDNTHMSLAGDTYKGEIVYRSLTEATHHLIGPIN